PAGIALDPSLGRIYWANFYADTSGGGNVYDGQIWGAALTGGVAPAGFIEQLVAGGDFLAGPFPSFPVVLKAPAGIGVPAISGQDLVGSTLQCSTGTWASDLVGAFLYRKPRADGFTYSWSLGGSVVGTDKSLANAQPGVYSCDVTASNLAGNAKQTSA